MMVVMVHKEGGGVSKYFVNRLEDIGWCKDGLKLS